MALVGEISLVAYSFCPFLTGGSVGLSQLQSTLKKTRSMESPAVKPVLLVIEDDDPIREVLTSCFEDIAGWQVIGVSSGQEGLSLVLSENPAAIILDVMMPEMDGITFLQHLKKLLKSPKIPVILITANVSGLELNQLRNLGVKGIIAKPFDPVLLAQQTAQLLGWNEP